MIPTIVLSCLLVSAVFAGGMGLIICLFPTFPNQESSSTERIEKP